MPLRELKKRPFHVSYSVLFMIVVRTTDHHAVFRHFNDFQRQNVRVRSDSCYDVVVSGSLVAT